MLSHRAPATSPTAPAASSKWLAIAAATLLATACSTPSPPPAADQRRPVPPPSAQPHPGTTPPAATPAAPPTARPPASTSPSPQPPASPAAPTASAPATQMAPSPLAAESRWLRELFGGTPVAVADDPDGSVLLAVPLTYAFDAAADTEAASAAKPPLRAVLDRLAQSLVRQPAARLQVTAPGPAAPQRATSVQTYLSGKGVAATRVGLATMGDNGNVLLRLVPGRVER